MAGVVRELVASNFLSQFGLINLQPKYFFKKGGNTNMPPKRKSRKVEQIQPTLPVLRPPSPQTNTPDNTSNRRAQESQEIPNATIVGTQLRVMADASQLSPTQWQQVELMRNSRLQATSG